jgi:uncharacterized protein YdeI (YjbR/CyaY-like superfamily)
LHPRIIADDGRRTTDDGRRTKAYSSAMPTTPTRCRQLALALPDAIEAPHFDYASFRVGGRIFATMPPDGAHLHVFLPEEQRAPVLALHPDSVETLWWGKSVVGLRVALTKATPALVESLLRQAWAIRAHKPAARAKKAAATSATVAPRKPATKSATKAQTCNEPRYFKTPAEFRAWLQKNAATAPELLVGLHKVDSGTPSLTWPQSVDEALCVGWIDGVRKRIDDSRYTIRFTPRRDGSHWSRVNLVRVATLTAEGRMQPAGLAAFARRDTTQTARASYEQVGPLEFPPDLLRLFKAQRPAWRWFEAQPPGYRKQMTGWVIGAKQDATRHKRLATLIAACAAGERIR